MAAGGGAKRRVLDASMELLNSIQRDTLDPEYAEVASGRQAPGRSRAPLLVLVVCVLAGLMFTTSGLRAGRAAVGADTERAELIAQINQLDERNRVLREQAQTLTSELQQLEAERLGPGHQPDPGDVVWAGSSPVSGPGVVLVVTDSQNDSQGIIVDQDIRQIVNGLWLAGAEAIAINGHRLSARTAIRQAGSAVTVDYRSMTTPYRIEAIGDPTEVTKAFNANSGGQWLNFLKRNCGVGWSIESSNELQLGADAGLGINRAGVP